MASDWAIDFMKGSMLLAVGWVANYFRKQINPFRKSLKKFIKVVEIVDRLDYEVSILRSKQMAYFHTDPNPVFIVNTQGDLIYANPAWGDMTGFSNIKDSHGRGYLKAIPPEDIELLEKQTERIIEHPSSYEGEVRFLHIKNKNIINTICRSELVRDKDGILTETIGRLKIIN